MKRLSVLPILALCGSAQAADSWRLNTAVQSTLVNDSGAVLRSGAKELGVLLSADYMDDGGLTVGYTKTTVQYLQALPEVKQRSGFISVREYFYADSVAGRITLRLDGHSVKNNDATALTDDVRAGVLQLGYLGYDRQQYYDLGYARSSYGSGFNVKQYTPSAAYALPQNYGWLQLRGYFIHASNPQYANGTSFTRALEMKYTYWPTKGSSLKPNSIQFGVLGGKRMFALDMDAASITNLSDIQTGGAMMGAEWVFGNSNKLLLLAGQNRYQNLLLSNSYSANFLNLVMNMSW
jgi:hypothetical protein